MHPYDIIEYSKLQIRSKGQNMNHIENQGNMNLIENQWGVERLSPDSSAEVCELLPALASNEIAAIQIGQFLGRQELDVIVGNMSRQSIAWYENKQNHFRPRL